MYYSTGSIFVLHFEHEINWVELKYMESFTRRFLQSLNQLNTIMNDLPNRGQVQIERVDSGWEALFDNVLYYHLMYFIVCNLPNYEYVLHYPKCTLHCAHYNVHVCVCIYMCVCKPNETQFTFGRITWQKATHNNCFIELIPQAVVNGW